MMVLKCFCNIIYTLLLTKKIESGKSCFDFYSDHILGHIGTLLTETSKETQCCIPIHILYIHVLVLARRDETAAPTGGAFNIFEK